MIDEDVINNITTSLLITGYTKTAFLTSKRFDEHPPGGKWLVGPLDAL